MKEFYLTAALLLSSSVVNLFCYTFLSVKGKYNLTSSFGNTTEHYAKVPNVYGKSVSAKLKQTALKNEPFVKTYKS